MAHVRAIVGASSAEAAGEIQPIGRWCALLLRMGATESDNKSVSSGLPPAMRSRTGSCQSLLPAL